MRQMIHVFARAKSKHGCAEQLRPILQRLAKASRSEAGVLTYELYETGKQGEFVFREEYVGREEFESHKKSRHVKVAVARAAPYMESALELWVVKPADAETGIDITEAES